MQNSDLVAAARSYLGTPFVHAGRNRLGLDCVGLIVRSAADVGLTVDVSHVNYNRAVNSEVLIAHIERYCRALAVDEAAEEGDVVLFTFSGNPQHLGLVTEIDAQGEVFFIHSYQSAGKVVEQRLAGPWRRRHYRTYRWRQ